MEITLLRAKYFIIPELLKLWMNAILLTCLVAWLFVLCLSFVPIPETSRQTAAQKFTVVKAIERSTTLQRGTWILGSWCPYIGDPWQTSWTKGRSALVSGLLVLPLCTRSINCCTHLPLCPPHNYFNLQKGQRSNLYVAHYDQRKSYLLPQILQVQKHPK